MRNRIDNHNLDVARVIATVRDEARRYTDPQATYPLAELARRGQVAGLIKALRGSAT